MENPPKLSGIARHLFRNGLISSEKAEELLTKSQDSDSNIISLIVESTPITTKQIATSVSTAYGLPYLDITTVSTKDLPIHLLPEAFVRKARV